MGYAELLLVFLGPNRVLVSEPSNVDVRSELDMVSRWLATWRISLDCMWLSNATRTGSALVTSIWFGILTIISLHRRGSPTPITLLPSHVYCLLGSGAFHCFVTGLRCRLHYGQVMFQGYRAPKYGQDLSSMVANYFLALLSTPWPACWSTWNLLLCTANAAVCRAILPGWLTYVYIREPAQTSLRNLFLAEIASSAGGAIEIRSRGQQDQSFFEMNVWTPESCDHAQRGG